MANATYLQLFLMKLMKVKIATSCAINKAKISGDILLYVAVIPYP